MGMRIAPENFADIFESLGRSSRGAIASGDKRRAARFEYQTQLEIVPCQGEQRGQILKVMMRDVSSRGMRLILNDPMEMGAQFITRIPRKNSAPVSILCTVMHVKGERRPPYHVGAEFTCVAPNPPVVAGDAQNEAIKRIQQSILDS
jgi:hypothetical protein